VGDDARALRAAGAFFTLAGDGRVNLNSAPAVVLQTIPGIDDAAAAAIVARRGRTPYRNLCEVASTVPEPARTAVRENLGAVLARVAFSPRDVEVRVRARGARGGRGGARHRDHPRRRRRRSAGERP
jgi:hypothetical protein